jgi:hypothetical protein
VAETESTLVDFSRTSERNLEGKPGTLYLGFHFSIYTFLGGIQMWGENILCLLLIIIMNWGM